MLLPVQSLIQSATRESRSSQDSGIHTYSRAVHLSASSILTSLARNLTISNIDLCYIKKDLLIFTLDCKRNTVNDSAREAKEEQRHRQKDMIPHTRQIDDLSSLREHGSDNVSSFAWAVAKLDFTVLPYTFYSCLLASF
jgi:hypothetical protein